MVDSVVERLRGAGLAVDVESTTGPGSATEIASSAWQQGRRHFVAAGGDGTAYEIVNGLFPAAASSPERRPSLGFLPLGTGNSFIRDFTERGVEDLISALVEGRRRACDLARLRYEGGELYFLNIASLGFAADVCVLANRRFKRFGAAAYALAVVVTVARLRRKAFPFRLDGGPLHDREMTFISFCNSRFTGGSMMMAPAADTGDGLIDVVDVTAPGRVALLRAFPRIFKGTHVDTDMVRTEQAARVDFVVAEPVTIMVDGEVLNRRPLSLDLLRQAVDVVV